MTTGNRPANQSMRRRERRFIPPFGDGSQPNRISNLLENMLKDCRFAPFSDVGLSPDDKHTLERRNLSSRPIEPRFELALPEIDSLTASLQVWPEELALGLSVRSRHLRRYDVLGQWDADSLPSEAWAPDAGKLSNFQSDRGLDFVLALRVIGDNERLRQQGMERGKVLCRREFSVVESVDSSTFPFEWGEFGGDSVYPAELLWAIKWHDPEEDTDRYNRPVNEVLTVYVNSKAQDALTKMDNVRGTNDLAWKMLAAEITTRIWADVLSNIEELPDEDDTATLIGQVFARLSRAGDIDYSKVKDLVEQDDSLLELRSLIHEILKVVS